MLRVLLCAAAVAGAAGPVCVTVGVWLVAGAGWAFIALGTSLLALAIFGLLADVVPDPEARP